MEVVMDITLSDGGGTQSSAILALIGMGKLPRPTRVIIADTGREATETWEYVNAYHRPLCEKLGIPFHIAGHDLATVDLYAGNGDLLIPAYTATGKLPTFCSDKWKKLVVRRYLRSIGIEKTTMWYGMSLDEIDRMRVSDVGWITNHYPLVFDVRLRRHECARVVEEFGWPTPPKSSCWMCPHRRDAQWRRMRDHYPDDWQKAVELDRAIREVDRDNAVYLHESGKPLDEADLDTAKDDELPLFTVCSEYCMI
jgi:hypothetical protein